MSNPAQPSQPSQPAPRNQAAAAPSLSAEAQTLFNQFSVIDPSRSGVGLDKIRMFYPRVGWNVIFDMVHELEAAGRLTKRAVLNSRGGVGYHLYTWTEA